MPSYEMSLIFRLMERPQISNAVKRTVETIIQKGGIVAGMENVGQRRLPYRINKHRKAHTHGHYFLVNFNGRPTLPLEMMEHLYRDSDVVRPRILRQELEVGRPCDYQPCYFKELDDETLLELKEQKKRHIKKL